MILRSARRPRRKWRDPDRFTIQDLIVEALRGLGAKPSRLIMTTLGTTIGIASLVVTVGFAQTAANHISQQFDAVAATHARVRAGAVPDGQPGGGGRGGLPWDADARVADLAGVENSGLLADVPLPVGALTTVAIDDPSAPPAYSPPLVAVTPGLLATLQGTVDTGRMFDAGHDSRRDRVVVLGAEAAERLGVSRIDRQPAVFIDGIPFAVIGIVDGIEIRSDLRGAALIPLSTAREIFEVIAPTELHLRLAIGAGQVVARQAPIALDPVDPTRFDVAAPGPPSEFRKNVSADIDLVFLILGFLALLAGGVGIATVTMLSVAERVGEIGLRRALGAADRDIRGQFMLESSINGLLGGLIGAVVGTGSVVVVALAQGWVPVVDPVLAAGCALLGVIVGLVAGVYPAARATRIEPATALRGGT